MGENYIVCGPTHRDSVINDQWITVLVVSDQLDAITLSLKDFGYLKKINPKIEYEDVHFNSECRIYLLRYHRKHSARAMDVFHANIVSPTDHIRKNKVRVVVSDVENSMAPIDFLSND